MSASDKKSPMAAIGSYDGTLPFRAIGLDVAVVTDLEDAEIIKILNKYAFSGYAAVFIEDTLYESLSEAISEISDSGDICIIPVPSQGGSTDVGLTSIRQSVERAVGMDIFGVK